jgi:general stress protein YciG
MVQTGNESNEPKKSRISNRGFASMTPEQQRQIASKGGQAAHKKGVAHEWTSEEARAAGRKGGQASKKGSRTTDTNENPEKSDVSRSTNTEPLKEEPDVTPSDELNPQRQDTRQDRASGR